MTVLALKAPHSSLMFPYFTLSKTHSDMGLGSLSCRNIQFCPKSTVSQFCNVPVALVNKPQSSVFLSWYTLKCWVVDCWGSSQPLSFNLKIIFWVKWVTDIGGFDETLSQSSMSFGKQNLRNNKLLERPWTTPTPLKIIDYAWKS